MVSPIKTALHDCSMTNMSSDVDPFALYVALPDQSGHLFGCPVHVEIDGFRLQPMFVIMGLLLLKSTMKFLLFLVPSISIGLFQV